MQGGVVWIARATMHASAGVGNLVAVIKRFVNCKRNRDRHWRIYTVLKDKVLHMLPCSKYKSSKYLHKENVLRVFVYLIQELNFNWEFGKSFRVISGYLVQEL
jgi:hypothetical protein